MEIVIAFKKVPLSHLSVELNMMLLAIWVSEYVTLNNSSDCVAIGTIPGIIFFTVSLSHFISLFFSVT